LAGLLSSPPLLICVLPCSFLALGSEALGLFMSLPGAILA